MNPSCARGPYGLDPMPVTTSGAGAENEPSDGSHQGTGFTPMKLACRDEEGLALRLQAIL